MKKILVFIVLISQFSIAQNINYDAEDYFYLKKSAHLKISLDKDILSIENNIFEQAKYNSSKKLFYANEYIPFDSFTEIVNIEAFTKNPITNEIIEVDHFETKDQIRGSVFYSDNQSINFVFPAVSKNAETTLKYKENITEPHFSSTFSFGSGVPIKEATYSVEVPKNVEIGYRTFNFENFDISFEKIETRKLTTYTWKANNINSFQNTQNSLSIFSYLPHVVVYIKNYKIRNKIKPVYNNLDDLYSWNASLNKQIDRSNLTEAHQITTDITKGLISDDEKTKAIFNWVQRNINYVAFEYGYGGLIARSASRVCKNRYGDCKDMSNLLYEMLVYVGIDAHHTWIGSRAKPYSHYEIPTGKVYDHMITSVFINNEIIFLDATDNYVPYGMPSSFIQGKEGMIALTNNTYKIVKVPEQAKEKNTTQIKTTISLVGDKLKASGKRTMIGYEMVNFIYDLKFNKDDKTDEQFLNTKYEIGNNKTTYSNINLGSLSSKNNSYSISYDFEINNYVNHIGSKVFLNLNLEKPLSKDLISIENQLYGKKIDHKYIRSYNTTFIIPKGYKLKSIPENISSEQVDYGFSFEYQKRNGKLTVNKKVYINTLAMQNEEFEAYNEFIKDLTRAYKKSIVLEKIN